MTYDKLTDKLEGKLLDSNLKALGMFFRLIVKPLGLATEPFFRKNFGERYFTGDSFFVCILLWIIATKGSSWAQFGPTPVAAFVYNLGFRDIGTWIYRHDYSSKVGALVICAYGLLGGLSLQSIHGRRRGGKMWHSMSRGESLFGSENKLRDFCLAAAAILVLSTFAPAVGFLFLLSRFASYHFAAKQQAILYARYLDAMDAKIEAEFLQPSLDRGEPPVVTEGLYCPLPKTFQGEHRARIARVVTGGPFDAGETAATSQKPGTQQRPPTNPRGDRETVAQVQMPAASDLAREAAAKAASVVSRFRRLLVFSLVLFIGVVGIVKGITVVRSILSGKAPPVLAATTIPEHPQMQKPNPTAPNQSQQPPSVATPTPQVETQKTNADLLAAQALLESQKRQEEQERQQAEIKRKQADEEQARLEQEKRRQEEQQARLEEQKRQEREKTIEQIRTTVDAQSAQLSKFIADCQRRLDDSTNKITGLARSSRIALKQLIDTNRADVVRVGQAQAEDLESYQNLVQSLTANPQADPQQVSVRLQGIIPKMEQVRQTVLQNLDHLDAHIAESPKKWSPLQFEIK
jgi:hypothetical protein